MTDLVTYQDGAVVSKEIIRKPTGTVTLFAFDRDQGLSETYCALRRVGLASWTAKLRSSSPVNLTVSGREK